ncbi:MAG TPA: response regulator transcription factor [Chloroflexota bacterium]|jgi:DNA-binding response OmpR family regulator|nr:response regulator transcription factor [Chloroflexota bacterium]
MNERILVVDDEPHVLDVVGRYLRHEGFETLLAHDGAQALTLSDDADLVILDLMLPSVDGIEVCRQLRAKRNIPIIMLTAKAEETDKLIGLGVGADDYVVKPFSPRELVARVQAVLRRTGPQTPTDDVIRLGDLRINVKTRTAERSGESLNLTAREFDLLAFLAHSPGQVFTREQLLDNVWDYHFAGDDSTVTVHVRRLREKIEPNPVRPQYVKTVWGVGYKLES